MLGERGGETRSWRKPDGWYPVGSLKVRSV